MFSLNTVFQRVILQTKSHWKLYLFCFLKGTEDQWLGPVVTFFSCSEHLCCLLGFDSLWTCIAQFLPLYFAQFTAVGTEKFLPLMHLKGIFAMWCKAKVVMNLCFHCAPD